MDNRPVLRRRRPPSGPPRTAVNLPALRWLLMGFMAGSRWNSRELADAAGIAKQRVSDVLNLVRLPDAEDTLALLKLLDVKASEIMIAPEHAEPEPERQPNAA
jgi:transcriptional regulator with XRE-family HTH domain